VPGFHRVQDEFSAVLAANDSGHALILCQPGHAEACKSTDRVIIDLAKVQEAVKKHSTRDQAILSLKKASRSQRIRPASPICRMTDRGATGMIFLLRTRPR
jgi:hypothetical protein